MKKTLLLCCQFHECHLGGVMVSVPATGPKVRGFKPGQRDGFLTAIKIRSTPSFGGQVKPRPHVVKFHGMLKNSTSTKRDISYTKYIISFAQIFLICYEMALLVRLPESILVNESGLFPCRDHSIMAVHTHISFGVRTTVPLAAAVQRLSPPHRHEQLIIQHQYHATLCSAECRMSTEHAELERNMYVLTTKYRTSWSSGSYSVRPGFKILARTPAILSEILEVLLGRFRQVPG
jgi:hypothetical protein